MPLQAAEVLLAMGAEGLCPCGRDLSGEWGSIDRSSIRCGVCVTAFVAKFQAHIEYLHRCGRSFEGGLPLESESWWP